MNQPHELIVDRSCKMQKLPIIFQWLHVDQLVRVVARNRGEFRVRVGVRAYRMPMIWEIHAIAVFSVQNMSRFYAA